MYDFTPQMEMMQAALYILKKNGISDVSALGGGTALAARYWNHRYSTDIDIFTHSKEDVVMLLREVNWDSKFKSMMRSLGYRSSKLHPVYIEFLLRDNYKMQFLNTIDRTNHPYERVDLWGMDVLVESVEEIIAKKIYYRAHKGNARDLFDIAIAIHKDPAILKKVNIELEKITELFYTVDTILKDEDLLEEYRHEIGLMNPNPKYASFSISCNEYLRSYLESYLAAINLGIDLDISELEEIEKHSYNEYIS